MSDIVNRVPEAIRIDTETATLPFVVCEAPNGDEFRVLQKYFSVGEGVEGTKQIDNGKVEFSIPKQDTSFEYIRMK